MMKALKKSLPVILFFIALTAQVSLVTAQKSTPAKVLAIKKLIDNQQYVFYAQYAMPMVGRQRLLTDEYTLSISKDTIVSWLPFFGRAYSAPIDPSEGGIKFTSINFDYKLLARKKSGWDITITPKDAKDVQLLTMTIFENGAASLQVTSTNKQSISYRGVVAGGKNKP